MREIFSVGIDNESTVNNMHQCNSSMMGMYDVVSYVAMVEILLSLYKKSKKEKGWQPKALRSLKQKRTS
jgi:hypothetical protein